MTATGPVLATASVTAPTGAVVLHTGGKPIKVEAAAPPTFSRIDVDTDIEDWLEIVKENCLFGQLDQSQWVVYASGFFGGEPRAQWLSRKREARLTETATDIMQWANFVAWCRKTFAVQNRAQMAYNNLQNLKQTSTVAKYMSKFNVLSLQAKMTEEQKIWAWYGGLKTDIRNKTEWDPVTKQRMASLQDAQSAAIAVDAFSTHSGTAGNLTGTTAVATAGRQSNGHRKQDFASSSAGEAMVVDSRRQRISLPRTNHTVSLGNTQPNGLIKFNPVGTFKGQDIPDSVQPILARLREDLAGLPATVFVPQTRRSDGQ